MSVSPPAAALQRGTILRDTQAGPGLISVAGRQLSFTLEQHWRSERPPLVGARVDVQLKGDELAGLTLVDDAQLAKEMASQAAGQVAARGQQLLGRALAEFGKAPLIALVALWLGWFAFAWISVRIVGTQTVSFSFWDMVKMLSAGNALEAMQYGQGGFGFWNVVALACALAPLLPLVWRDRRAGFGLAAPLLFMLLQAARLYWGIQSAAGEMQKQMGGLGGQMGRAMQDIGGQMLDAMLKSISLGLGLYLSVAAALVLGFFALARLRR